MINLCIITGQLGAVGSLKYNFINSTSLNITWSAPYTLDGVDILGYNITITDADTVLYTRFTQDTQFVISNTDGDPCIELMLTVSAYNEVGDGDKLSFNYYMPEGNTLNCYCDSFCYYSTRYSCRIYYN